jgi:hypothetical protein
MIEHALAIASRVFLLQKRKGRHPAFAGMTASVDSVSLAAA